MPTPSTSAMPPHPAAAFGGIGPLGAGSDPHRVREMAAAFAGAPHFDAGGSDDPLVTQALADLAGRVAEIVRVRRAALTQAHIDALVDTWLQSEPTAAVHHALALDNARERAWFVGEYPCLTSHQVAQQAGHSAANASATATRWKKAGRIIGLPWKDGDLYPTFQFEDGQPRGVIQRLITVFAGARTPWQIALWLVAPNAWLDGATPLARLSDEAAVVAAAQHEVGAIFG